MPKSVDVHDGTVQVYRIHVTVIFIDSEKVMQTALNSIAVHLERKMRDAMHEK